MPRSIIYRSVYIARPKPGLLKSQRAQGERISINGILVVRAVPSYLKGTSSNKRKKSERQKKQRVLGEKMV